MSLIRDFVPLTLNYKVGGININNKGKLVLKIETIKNLIDGQIAREKVSIILDCNVKTITRMKKAYLLDPSTV